MLYLSCNISVYHSKYATNPGHLLRKKYPLFVLPNQNYCVPVCAVYFRARQYTSGGFVSFATFQPFSRSLPNPNINRRSNRWIRLLTRNMNT